jgi:hypothetical protein
VICAAPGATDVTVAVAPVPATVAMLGLLLVHVTVGEAATPADVVTVAVSCPVTPIPVSASVAGATLTAVTVAGGVTVTVALPLCPPELAVICAVPGPTAVTVAVGPEPDTVATPGALLVHVTAGDAATPADVFTVAVSDAVLPTAPRATVCGVTATDVVVTGGGGGGGVTAEPPPSPPPQAASQSGEVRRTLATIRRGSERRRRMARWGERGTRYRRVLRIGGPSTVSPRPAEVGQLRP